MTSTTESPKSKTSEKQTEARVPAATTVPSPSRPVPCCRLPKEPQPAPTSSQSPTGAKPEEDKAKKTHVEKVKVAEAPEKVEKISATEAKVAKIAMTEAKVAKAPEKVEKIAATEAKVAKAPEKVEKIAATEVKVAKITATEAKVVGNAEKFDEPAVVSSLKETELPLVPKKQIPIINKSPSSHPCNVAVPRNRTLRAVPLNMDERPLVVAVHLVPSLPMALFEVLAEILEVATGKAVVLLHEPRANRPVAKDLVDIAFLPASDKWSDGTLLPVSFVFEHRLNKTKSPAVYVDVVVAPDCIRNVEDIMDLRGHRCALPDRRKKLGAANLLFSHLKSKGEGPTFFGNTLDSGSQLAALQMVAGKQAEVGVLESPVINYHRNTLPGVNSLYALATLGPLPPYRIMVNNNLQGSIRGQVKESLLRIEHDDVWMDRLRPYGISGFAEYSEERYSLEDVKTVAMSVPYY